MKWIVRFADEFEREFEGLESEVQDELFSRAGLLGAVGPGLGRPTVDTLNDSRFTNMKELRFKAADGVWRVAFAFDPRREAILLAAGDKSGGSEKLFYKGLIQKADSRYAAHLNRIRRG